MLGHIVKTRIRACPVLPSSPRRLRVSTLAQASEYMCTVHLLVSSVLPGIQFLPTIVVVRDRRNCCGSVTAHAIESQE